MQFRRFLLILLALFLVFGSLYLLYGEKNTVRPDPNGLYVFFADVGQADCALILQGGHAMLVDTGGPESFDKISDTLDRFGVKELDLLVLTHPHTDHIGSAADILKRYDVRRIFMPFAVNETEVFEDLLDTVSDLKIPASVPEPGDTVLLGGAELFFLSPPRVGQYDELNDRSIVFRLRFSGIRLLFTGDMEQPTEGRLLSSGYDLGADLIKVPHHGSLSSSSAALVKAVSPSYAVFTTAAESDDGLPNQTVVDRYRSVGAELYFTHLDGDVWAEVKNGRLTVLPFSESGYAPRERKTGGKAA